MASAACQGDGDGVDYISDLSDDLLLHVLSFLSHDSRDVICTSVLSTRWRNLWKRAPVLRLWNLNRNGKSGMDCYAQFNDFVHNILARRTYSCVADSDIDKLVLRTCLWPGKSRAQVWLRRAMRHTVTSLVFSVWVPQPRSRMSIAMMTSGYLADKLRPRLSLPCRTRVTALELDLHYAVLLLPPAVEFHALTELTLSSIWFSDDDGPHLGHLLSSPSCCPRLRKLTLSHLPGLHDLRLHGGALETLHLESLSVRRLDVDAPRLAVLDVEGCFMHRVYNEYTSLIVQAPALKKLEYSLMVGGSQLDLHYYTIQLMQECRPSDGHTLHLYVLGKLSKGEEDDAMREIPKLPGVTNMTLHFDAENNHYLGATVTSLLARCSNLEYLHLDSLIHLQDEPQCGEGCEDCNFRGSWKDNVISLEHLREVKLGGFSGKEHYCLDMVHLLLMSAPALERMIVTAKASMEFSWLPKLKLAESLESSLPWGRGKWTALRAANVAMTSEYEWKPNLEMLETRLGDASNY